MRDVYGDDFDSLAGDASDELIPASARKLAGAAVFLGLVMAMGVWSYRLGTRDATEVPVIRAMEGPLRVAPADPGGLRAEHQGLEVNAVLAGNASPDAAAPVKAEAAPQILSEEDAAQGELIVAEQAKEAQAAPEALEIVANSNDAPQNSSAPTIQSELAAMVEAAAPVGEPSPEELPGETIPTTRPMVRPANLAVARSTPAPEAKPVKLASASPSAATSTAAIGKGARLVQLGAYDSEAIAQDTWNRLQRRQSDLLGSKSVYIERATSNARVFYRLRVAGFQNTEQTRDMCVALKARGIDCIPVTLQ